jgi:hypothetical protein
MMSGVATERDTVESESDASDSVSLSQLIDKLGEGSGQELFERMDSNLRHGDRLYGKTVRAARQSLSASRIEGHAQLVMPGRAGSGARIAEADSVDGILMISLNDLEAVVKANNPNFDWAEEFAPRRDLPVATTPIVTRSGVRGQRLLKL